MTYLDSVMQLYKIVAGKVYSIFVIEGHIYGTSRQLLLRIFQNLMSQESICGVEELQSIGIDIM